MKMYVFIPNMPRPRNVMLLAERMTQKQTERAIAALIKHDLDVNFDQSTANDSDPNLMQYVFASHATFIVTPEHVTDQFVADAFDCADDNV